MNFVLKEKKYKKDDTFKLSLDKGFEFLIAKNDALVTLYNPLMIEFYINERYLIKYKKLISLILLILNDDDNTETDFEIALDEISRLEAMILNEFKDHLKLEKIKLMLKEVYLLKDKLKKKRELSYFINAGKSR